METGPTEGILVRIHWKLLAVAQLLLTLTETVWLIPYPQLENIPLCVNKVIKVQYPVCSG